MKKRTLIGIAVAAVILIAAGAVLWVGGGSVDAAESAHQAVYNDYAALRANASASTVTVHEDGVVIGSYSLDELGLLSSTMAAIDRSYSEMDRMAPVAFTSLPAQDKISWNREDHLTAVSVKPDISQLNTALLMQELLSHPRQAPQNAYVDFTDGSFLVHEEVQGNQLNLELVEKALTETLSAAAVTAAAPLDLLFELADFDCYDLPQLTVANSLFDFPAMLHDSIQTVTVTLDIHGKTETLGPKELEDILYTNDKGRILVHEDVLEPMVEKWWETYQEKNVPFMLDSYVEGPVPIDFITVDYEINKKALMEQLSDALVQLKSVTIEPEWYCWRNAQAFDLGDEYIEIDINNQVMTYFKDGEVLVTTDIVSGNTWGYPTPQGLYKIENKDMDQWLRGEDYNVHVDYWMGFVGWMIGIHDADWRTKFGGDNYVMNGSHGCINTPKEATKTIYENVEVGVPVLVHGK